MAIIRNPNGTANIDPQNPQHVKYRSRAIPTWVALVKGIQEALIKTSLEVGTEDEPPTNLTLPFIPTQVFRVGDTFDASDYSIGTWAGIPDPTFTVTVKKAGTEIPIPYTIVEGDLGLSFVVSVAAFNRAGFLIKESTPSTPILAALAAPTNVVPPSLVIAGPVVGTVINTSNINVGSWKGNPTPTLVTEVYKNDSLITLPYTVVSGDIGSTFKIKVTASNSQGSFFLFSAASDPVVDTLVPPDIISAAYNDTTPEVGQTLNVIVSVVGNPPPTLTYEHYKNNVLYSTNPTITVQPGDVAGSFRCIVFAENSEGTDSFNTATTSPVPAPLAAPVNTGLPVFSDTTPNIGDVITSTSCSNGTWTGNPSPSFSKQYKKNGANITVPYTVVTGDAGASFSCTVTATNSQGSAQATSAATQAVPPPQTSSDVTWVAGASGVDTATMPAHAIGDLMLGYAFNGNNGTVPTVPSGWTLVKSHTAGSTAAGVLAKKIAQSTSETAGTWTNATSFEVGIWRGAADVGGNNATSGSASSNVGYGSPTAWTRTDNTSKLAWFVGHSSVDTNLGNPPTNAINRLNPVNSSDELAIHESSSYLSSWTATAVQVGGTAGNYVSIVAEIMKTGSGGGTTEPPPGGTINDPEAPPANGIDVNTLQKRTTNFASSFNGQVIENMWIDSPSGDALVITHDDVTVRNVLVDHREGKGINCDGADRIRMYRTQVRKVNAPTGINANANSAHVDIYLNNSHDGIFKFIITEDGASGFYANNSRNNLVQYYQTYRNRGPFPRGQGLQFANLSHNCVGRNVFMWNPPNDSFTEDCFNVGSGSQNCRLYDALIIGNNSPSGWGVLIEQNSVGFQGFDVDTVNQYTGGTQSVCGGDPGAPIFTRHRDIKHQSVHNSRGNSTSNFLKFGVYNTTFGTQFLACTHDGSGNNNVSSGDSLMKVKQITFVAGLTEKSQADVSCNFKLFKTPMVRP